jgi:hypothetical protein
MEVVAGNFFKTQCFQKRSYFGGLLSILEWEKNWLICDVLIMERTFGSL